MKYVEKNSDEYFLQISTFTFEYMYYPPIFNVR